MKLLIEIPEKTYHMINAGQYDYGDMNVIIQNGTPLPKEHGAEPLDCGNCEIVQASINTGIRTATRLVDDVLNKIRAEIEQIEINGYVRDAECFTAGINTALNVINKYREER